MVTRRDFDSPAKPTWCTGCGNYGILNAIKMALADFDRVLELDADYAWAFGSRGETYGLMGNYEAALADFDRALELNADDAWAFGSRGDTYLSMGNYEAALADLDRALELDPDGDWYFYKRGLVYTLMNVPGQAGQDFTRAITLAKKTCAEKPQDWRIILNLAFYYLVTGQTKAAEQLYGTALTESVPIHNLQEAIEDLDELLHHYPEHVQALTTRMQLQQKLAECGVKPKT